MPNSTEVHLPTEDQQRAMGVRPRDAVHVAQQVAQPYVAPPPLPHAPPQVHVGPRPKAIDVDVTELADIYALALECDVTSPGSATMWSPFSYERVSPFVGFSLNALFDKSSVTLPKTFTQVDTLPDKKLWRLAGDQEYKAKMATNKTGRLVKRSQAYDQGKKVIPTKVVFGYKYNDVNSIKERTTRYTALVTCNSPRMSTSPTLQRLATGFRAFCCHITNRRMHLFMEDVTKAFTQSTLDVDLYIEQMDGYVEDGFQPDGRPNLVIYIKKGEGKAIEGLVQSGHIFQTGRNAALEAPIPQGCGLTICDTEPCISRRVATTLSLPIGTSMTRSSAPRRRTFRMSSSRTSPRPSR